ncbi:MAG: hypothetical protein ACRBBO_00655 [Cognatishimia sp.]|uniref:hypothetical protein n=1 Tax=Cognatishimia sp. 1_MG-2023 TaxID=3062642 RepID=UPI0026E25303|nr:hypothetical protein [Cognatishimia sp. 1_MG-2023]MDO6726509.1 hypothetical protein [Cognatishimia sp. 1_MG-2023]
MGTKIATCCYCGTRAALRLGGKVQHELACSSCGAPLHELKQMPIEPRRVEKQQHYDKPRSYSKPLKKNKYYKKKKKSWSKQLFDGLDDIIDIFD